MGIRHWAHLHVGLIQIGEIALPEISVGLPVAYHVVMGCRRLSGTTFFLSKDSQHAGSFIIVSGYLAGPINGAEVKDAEGDRQIHI